MSAKEIDRLGVVQRVVEGRLPQKKAALMLGVSVRQARRLCLAFKRDGATGLVSKSRGRPGNRELSTNVREQALAIVRERYSDFGPTLAAEKLSELHGIRVSKETLRRWMRSCGLWLSRKQRVPTPHQPRFRRECLGELVQIDGCQHAWFEERGPYCSLLVYVDDATGRLMELLFVKTESAFGYFAATTAYLRRHGKPVAFYSDKHSIFRVAREGTMGAHGGVSQFGRALAELNIDIICANSPQAKGRVERMNKTLQDRLVKELRLHRISTMEAGNAFLAEFMQDFNRRFARPARSAHNAHRPLQPTEDLGQIFSWREVRTMTNNLVVNYERASYVVTPGPDTTPLAGRRRQVEIHKWADGRIEIHHEGRVLPFAVCERYPIVCPGDVVESKRISEAMAEIRAAQRDGFRARDAAKRFALGKRRALAPSPTHKKPDGDVKAPAEVDPGPPANHYLIRWVGQEPHLYERVFKQRSASEYSFKEIHLGPVDPRAAMRWESRGNPLYPPPLVGATVPALAAERAQADDEIGSSSEEHPGKTLPRSTDGLSRLSAALWFADTFHAAEVQRIVECNEAADLMAAQELKGSRRSPMAARASGSGRLTLSSPVGLRTRRGHS